MTGALIVALSPALQAPALFTPTPKAAQRVLEFFTAQLTDNRRSVLSFTEKSGKADAWSVYWLAH